MEKNQKLPFDVVKDLGAKDIFRVSKTKKRKLYDLWRSKK